LRFLEPGSTISHSMVSFHTASSVTLLSELTLTPPSDLSAHLHQAQAPMPDLTLRCPSTVLTGPTLTSLSLTSKSQR
jgi:hypothetical protein